MAQRTVHYVFGKLLAERCGIADDERFLFGTLLPDAIADRSERDASHYASFGADGSRRYDFERFRSDFSERIPGDALYLGYYMHLVEDDFYREFCYKEHRFRFRREEDVRALHRDYHLLNPYLREAYGLRKPLLSPEGFAREPLSRVARFEPEGLVRDYAADLAERPQGEFTYLSPAMIEDFIARCLPEAELELRAVLRGGRLLSSSDYAWRRDDE